MEKNTPYNKPQNCDGEEIKKVIREKYEIPEVKFVPVKIEERLMQGACLKVADLGSPCSEPFQFS